MYQANTIAQYFINKYGNNGNITPMKIIKLVYIAHGWYLGITNKQLISESPEAWKYGPVIPSVYNKYKSYRNQPIYPTNNIIDDLGIEQNDQVFLDKIWSIYGKEDGVQLSRRTHQPGTPWSIVWDILKNSNEFYTLQIDNDLIRSHYKHLIETNKQKKAQTN